MFNNKSLPTNNYSYDVQMKKNIKMTNLEFVRDQLSKARLYKNKLIELEQKRRNEISNLRTKLFPDYEQLEKDVQNKSQEIKDFQDEISKTNIEKRCKSATKEQKLHLSKLREEKKELYKVLKEMKDSLWKNLGFQEKIEIVESDHKEKLHEARHWISKEINLYSYSYVGVEQSLSKIRKGKPPEHKKWNGSGRLCCQMMLNKSYPIPMTWERACSGLDTRLRISKCGKYHIIKVRLGMTPKPIKPIWVECPIVLHRPLPENSVIKWVNLICKKDGFEFKYKIMFVISRPEGFEKPDRANEGIVGCDINWRETKDGIRELVYKGDDGIEGELAVPQKQVEYHRKIKDIQSIRDKEFNGFKKSLKQWIKEKPKTPEWLSEPLKYLDAIKSKRKMLEIAKQWKENRFENDELIYEFVSAWEKKEVHLYMWQNNAFSKYDRWRKDFYRCFVAKLRKQYKYIVLESKNDELMNLQDMASKPKPEDKDNKKGIIKNRNLASVGLLREFLCEQMDVIKVPMAGTSYECNICHEKTNLTSEIMQTCPNGHTWDRDRNSATNILARGLAVKLEEEAISSQEQPEQEVMQKSEVLASRNAEVVETERFRACGVSWVKPAERESDNLSEMGT